VKKRFFLVLLLLLLVISCLLFLLHSCMPVVFPPIQTTVPTTVPASRSTAASTTVTTTASSKASSVSNQTSATTAVSTEVYVSPIDFDAFHAQNEDIYAYIEIPGSDISYPVVQSATDDAYYLKHDIDGNETSRGAIFSEHQYNSNDFSDPVTILYGHRRKDMTMFSTLQPLYSDVEHFEQYREIIIYLPDRELHYRIFAAIPYDNRHILYTYDFSNVRDFTVFFNSVFGTRVIGANVDMQAWPDYDDSILILSTCLWGDNNQRYLVIASLMEDE